jgi:hypothetical protein
MRKKHQAIARSAQVAVMAMSMLLSVFAAIYGAIQSFLSSQAKPAIITIGSEGRLKQKNANRSESAFAASYKAGIEMNRRDKRTHTLVEERRSKLSPDFMQPDVKEVYYEEFNNFLDCIWKEA